MADVDAYLEFAVDPCFAFFATPVDPTRELIADFFARRINAAADELVMFVIVHGETEAVIGSVELDFDSRNEVASERTSSDGANAPTALSTACSAPNG